MITRLFDHKDVQPAFNEQNWKVVGQDKVEIINGDIYGKKDHWGHKLIENAVVILGFYVNTDKPNELVRLAGHAPDLWVYVFERK
jgi:hypothetical protein